MNYNAEKDILNVFGPSLDKDLADGVIRVLNRFLLSATASFKLRTRKEKNQPLVAAGHRYFAVTYQGHKDFTLFVGTIERGESDTHRPVFRFRNTNPILEYLPTECKFKSRIPNWTCVKISPQLINILPKLMKAEVDAAASSLSSRDQWNLLPVETSDQSSDASSDFTWLGVIAILAVLVVLVVLFLPSGAQKLPVQTTVETQAPQKPKVSPTSPSKPQAPVRQFQFHDVSGKLIHASAFASEEHGSERKVIVFVPFLEHSDGSFYNASLRALHEMFGKQRGLFLLEDAQKEYDPITNAKVIFWEISNPEQRFYSYPVVDSDSRKIASIVIWVK